PGATRALHSLPTRRSSDLQKDASPLDPTTPAFGDREGGADVQPPAPRAAPALAGGGPHPDQRVGQVVEPRGPRQRTGDLGGLVEDRKSTRLNSSHVKISYA